MKIAIYIWGISAMLSFQQVGDDNLGFAALLGAISFGSLLKAIPQMAISHYIWGISGALAFYQHSEGHTLFAIALAVLSFISLIYALIN